MAQLVKLQDYISRYQWDVYRYTKQFIRVKNDNWEKLYLQWQEPKILGMEKDQKESAEQPQSMFSKWKSRLKRKKPEILEPKTEPATESTTIIWPGTETELKQYFLDKIFHFQLKWATSTISDISFMNEQYRRDLLLKYLLQRFPDNYLIMYFPVFEIKKAPIETEIILISPIGIEIVHFMEQENPLTVIMATDERSWTMETNQVISKVLSPLIAVKRTEKLVKSMLNQHHIDFPVQKTILSRTNQIIYHTEPYKTRIIDKENYGTWFENKRKLSSPLKGVQLQAADVLLRHVQTTSFKRAEWEDDAGSHPFAAMED